MLLQGSYKALGATERDGTLSKLAMAMAAAAAAPPPLTSDDESRVALHAQVVAEQGT
jgi:hypothetical protein